MLKDLRFTTRRQVAKLLAAAGVLAVLAPQAWAQAGDGALRMTMADFKKHMAADDIVVIDVRGPDAYQAGHIPGALSVPYSEVAGKAAEYKKSKKAIVAYCA